MGIRDGLAGDLWGGLAATLVALPSAIAFGVTILSPLGSGYAAQGAVSGILGATAIGLVAASFGGTQRLISAPCAPAAAVLSALAIDLSQKGVAPDSALFVLTLVGLTCGIFQLLFGFIGLGRLIKYMPYPVVSGYMSGVGLIIIVSQIPKLLGAPPGTAFWDALGAPSGWTWQAIAVGTVTAVVMLGAPRVTRAVPAAILGLAAGALAYFGLGLADRSLLQLSGNVLVVGPLGGSGAGFVEMAVGRWSSIGAFEPGRIADVLIPGATLAVLLSIDTLKTCVITDALTRTRHQSNRELVGQGLGNVASAFVAGVPGSGTMGATLVNIAGGAQTRLSGVIEGALSLVAFLVLARAIAWVPIAALAGTLIVIGVRMFDVESLRLLRSRTTVFDFVVVAAVVIVAQTVGLIAASGVGIGLAILLFVREQIGGAIVRRKVYGSQTFSKQVRLPEEMALLQKYGDRSVIFELQGSLFFGTTDQLYTALESELEKRAYVILDMRRVQSVDVTAAHMLTQIEDILSERGAYLIFSHVPKDVPTGQDLRGYLGEVGPVRPERPVLTFAELDDAVEWVENRILAEQQLARTAETPLELSEMELFRKRKPETLAALEACMEKRSLKSGEALFQRGDTGDELFLIRRGTVRILLPIEDRQSHHLATFRRGDFVGEMSFLDRQPRSANAVASADVELFVLSRARFDALAEEHRRLASNLLEGLARTLAIRMRYTNTELRMLRVS